MGYLSFIFLEAKFGASTRISEAKFGAKPPRPPDMEVPPREEKRLPEGEESNKINMSHDEAFLQFASFIYSILIFLLGLLTSAQRSAEVRALQRALSFYISGSADQKTGGAL